MSGATYLGASPPLTRPILKQPTGYREWRGQVASITSLLPFFLPKKFQWGTSRQDCTRQRNSKHPTHAKALYPTPKRPFFFFQAWSEEQHSGAVEGQLDLPLLSYRAAGLAMQWPQVSSSEILEYPQCLIRAGYACERGTGGSHKGSSLYPMSSGWRMKQWWHSHLLPSFFFLWPLSSCFLCSIVQ